MNKKKPLNGVYFETTKYPKKLVFLLHGYGDNAENFIFLSSHLNDLKLNFLQILSQ